MDVTGFAGHARAVGVLEALAELDRSVLRGARDLPGPAISLFYVFTVIGAGWGLFAVLPFLARRATRGATLGLLGAVVATSGTVSALKALVGRVRPCDALGWCTPILVASPGGGSFPSGHAAGSFAFAAFVTMRSPRWAPLALAYAALVAWSRCVLGVHYPSDVVGGAFLGAARGAAFAGARRRRAGAGRGEMPAEPAVADASPEAPTSV